jgi:hypothetical protein
VPFAWYEVVAFTVAHLSVPEKSLAAPLPIAKDAAPRRVIPVSYAEATPAEKVKGHVLVTHMLVLLISSANPVLAVTKSMTCCPVLAALMVVRVNDPEPSPAVPLPIAKDAAARREMPESAFQDSSMAEARLIVACPELPE